MGEVLSRTTRTQLTLTRIDWGSGVTPGLCREDISECNGHKPGPGAKENGQRESAQDESTDERGRTRLVKLKEASMAAVDPEHPEI